jgi:putative ABC transport system permease protein
VILESIVDDARLAWRALRRAKAFTAVAVLTLAVGVAGTATMSALVRGVLLRPLPVRDQERLVVLWKQLPASAGMQWPFAARDVRLLNEQSRTLEHAAGYGYQDPVNVPVVEDGSAGYVNLSRITGDFFDVLGVRPLIGRSITAADDATGAEPMVVLTHGFWQRHYGGSRDALGRRIVINEQTFTIVGIMPPDVEFPRGVEAWVAAAPLAATVQNPFREAVVNELRVVARMRPGVAIEEAASELRTLAPQIEASAPQGAPPNLTPALRPYVEAIVGDARRAMLVLFAAVALVLLIATANVANLLLMRGEARRPELAIRTALGASRRRLVRQMVIESAIVAACAGVVGLLVTRATVPALTALVPGGLPRAEAVRVDLSVVIFAIAAAFVAAAGAALVPAILATRARVAVELAGTGRTAGGSAARQGRRALVVAQVALAVTVLAATGLLMRSLLRLQAVAEELAASRLMFVPLALPQEKYAAPERRLQFLNGAIDRLESLPGVLAATPVNVEPLSGIGWTVPAFTVEGQSRERAEANPSLNLEAIHPNYFRVFQLDLVRGRSFTAADDGKAPRVAIVSADVAARTWPGEDPLGKRVKLGSADSDDSWRTIVGVVTPTRYRDMRERRASIYLPAEQLIVTAQMFVIRVTASPTAAGPPIVEAFRALDPDVRVLRVAPFDELLDAPLARPRFIAFIIGVFAIAALFLAGVGLYAVMAAFVRLREREIGVRVALGATASHVRRLVIGEGFRLAGAGGVIGFMLAAAGNQLLRGLLFETNPLDPSAILIAAASLVVAATIACYLPARRATRSDPVAMLRAE